MVSPTSGRDAAATITARGQGRAAQRPSSPTPAPTTAPVGRGALPSSLLGIPAPALLAGGGIAVVTALVVTLVVVRSDKAITALEDETPSAKSAVPMRATPSAVAAAAVRPTAAEIDAARLGGADALAALARRFPEEPAVLSALCVAEVREKKDYAAGLRALRHLLEVAPDKAADKGVQEALLDIANGPPEVAAEAFELIKTKLGERGPDLIFELNQSATGKYAKEHAAAALADPELLKGASKALLVADELRRNRPCGRKALISRASADGDGRSLAYLRPLVASKGCAGAGLASLFRGGGPECYACFTPQDRAAITAAIDAIEKREKR